MAAATGLKFEPIPRRYDTVGRRRWPSVKCTGPRFQAVTIMLMPPIRLPILPQVRTPLHAALRSCVGPLGLVFAYSCSYNLLLFAPSIYLLQIYDRVLSSRSGETLLLLTLIVAITVLVGGVFDALRRAVLGRLGAWLDEIQPAGASEAFALLKAATR